MKRKGDEAEHRFRTFNQLCFKELHEFRSSLIMSAVCSAGIFWKASHPHARMCQGAAETLMSPVHALLLLTTC